MADLGSVSHPFESIFDAFRHFAPGSPLICLEQDECRLFRRSNKYEILDMGDGSFAAFPNLMFMQCYRGENCVYPSCEASIFRNNKKHNGDYDEAAILIDELRCEEFKSVLLTFPQVQYALKDNHRVDFLALAQHYELNTRLLDITSEPEIAAYFATHRWIDGVPAPIENGIGCIRGISPLMFVTSESMENGSVYSEKFHAIGLQCFKRPGLQAAFGIESEMGEDFSEYGWKVYFRQNAMASQKIHINFHYDAEKNCVMPNSWLFPDEEIAKIAEKIRKTRKISDKTVKDYCMKNGKDFALVNEMIREKGMEISESACYVLSPDKKLEFMRKYKDRPYGDVALNARLCYIPQSDK